YFDHGTMFAVPIDLERLEARGTPAPVLEDVTYKSEGDVKIDFARNGTVVYESGEPGVLMTVRWLESGGQIRSLLPIPWDYRYLVLAPDGVRLALSSAGDIRVWEAARP